MKILHTETSMGWGGQEIRIYREMLGMRERGHKVMLAAPVESQIYQRAGKSGIHCFKFSTNKLTLPLNILRLYFFLKKNKFDVINTHSSQDGWIGGLAGKFAKIPLIIRSRHIEVDYPSKWRSRIAFDWLPHHVLTTSQRIADRLVEEVGVPENKITCLPTGVDTKVFHPQTSSTLHDEIKIPTGTPVFGMISVLRSWKGHDYFIEAAQHVLDYFPNAHFIIAGDGPRREAIISKIKHMKLTDHIHLLGHRQDVANVIAGLTALILPSYAHEGIPQIILQAQAMAKPVIGTTIGGIPEVIDNDQTGLIVPPKDIHRLADAMERILKDEMLARFIGEQSLQHILRKHTFEHMCEDTEALYKRYLKNT